MREREQTALVMVMEVLGCAPYVTARDPSVHIITKITIDGRELPSQ